MVEFIGYLAGFIAMVTFLPQVIRTLRIKKSDDISLWMLSLTLLANALYEIYAIALSLKACNSHDRFNEFNCSYSNIPNNKIS